MNHESFENILALYPNVKGIGYAFYQEEHEPKYYGLSVVKPMDNAKCMKRITAMIQIYEPSLILLPTPDGKHNRKRKRIQELLDEIILFAKKQGIPVKSYSREQIRLVFEQFDAKSKQEIAEKICIWHPQLEACRPTKRKLYMPEDYHQGMFDSISLAITHFYVH